MQLEGAILHYHLSKRFSLRCLGPDAMLRCERPKFYEPSSTGGNHLLLVEWPALHACLAQEQNRIILCAAPQGAEAPPSSNLVFLVYDACQQIELYNVLTDIFDRYDQWDYAVRTAVFENRDFAALLRSCSLTLLENYALTDANFAYVAYSDSSKTFGYVDKFVTADNRLPMEHVNSLVTSPDFHRNENNPGPYELNMDEHTVDINIFHQGKRVGRLTTLVGNNTVQNQYCKAIFTHLQPYISILYDRYGDFYTPKHSLNQLHATIEKLLDGGAAEPHALQDLLEANGGRTGDTYLAVQIQSGYRSDKNVYAEYLVSQLEIMWHGAACVKNSRGVFLLQNVSLFHRQHKTRFRTSLACMLRDSLMVAGIGRDLQDLSLLRTAQRQACIALDLCKLKSPEQWVARFDDYALEYLLQYGIGELPPDQVCSLALLKIRNYDAETGTQYFKTLGAYFRSQYNASAAAKSLYIHRSTFINRMERISQLAELPMTEWRDRLYLELSYQILE